MSIVFTYISKFQECSFIIISRNVVISHNVQECRYSTSFKCAYTAHLLMLIINLDIHHILNSTHFSQLKDLEESMKSEPESSGETKVRYTFKPRIIGNTSLYLVLKQANKIKHLYN